MSEDTSPLLNLLCKLEVALSKPIDPPLTVHYGTNDGSVPACMDEKVWNNIISDPLRLRPGMVWCKECNRKCNNDLKDRPPETREEFEKRTSAYLSLHEVRLLLNGSDDISGLLHRLTDPNQE